MTTLQTGCGHRHIFGSIDLHQVFVREPWDGTRGNHLPLTGRSILVVEDDLIVAQSINDCLQDAGAQVVIASKTGDALPIVENADLAAAVLDVDLGNGDSTIICQRLDETADGYLGSSPLCRNMAEPNRLSPGGRASSHIIQQTQFHQGPLPRFEDFEAYDRVLRGAADRILRMAEKQAAHRQELESRALKGDLTKAMMGSILACVSMSGAVYLLLHDKPIQGLAALIVALGSAFGPKIYIDFIQPKPEQPSQLPSALP